MEMTSDHTVDECEPSGNEASYAQWAYQRRWIGYYGVNPATGIARCGPYMKRAPCLRRVRRINATPPIAPHLLVIKAVRS